MHATFYVNTGFIGDSTHMSWAQLQDLYSAGRVFAENIPPLDPYATRTPPDPKQGTTVATIEGYVTAAEQHGGGWVQLTFHHVCSGCDAYSITAADFQALLDWLQPRTAIGTVVDNTAQVIGGPFNPPVTP